MRRQLILHSSEATGRLLMHLTRSVAVLNDSRTVRRVLKNSCYFSLAFVPSLLLKVLTLEEVNQQLPIRCCCVRSLQPSALRGPEVPHVKLKESFCGG